LEYTVNGQVMYYPLAREHVCRIGREPNANTLVLPSDLVSRKHAVIQEITGGLFLLTDLKAANPTLINGVEVSAAILANDDRIMIGDFELVFHQVAPASSGLTDTEITRTRIQFKQQFVTVLVVDIRAFTVICQKISPASIVPVIGAFSREAGERVRREGARAHKYTGDGLMAVWLHKTLVPPAEEYLPVLRSACGIARLAEEAQAQFRLPMPIRIGAGLNSGEATLGNFGTKENPDFNVVGEPVNKAFRLESVTKEIPCDLVMGETAYLLSRKLPCLKTCGEHTVNLKGYDEPQKVYAFSFHDLNL
jgi:adenylate cyclase